MSSKSAIMKVSDIDAIYKGGTEEANYSKEQEAKLETFWSKGNVPGKVM